MYNNSRQADEAKFPDAQFSTGVQSQDLLDYNIGENRSESSYFQEGDDDLQRESHENGFLSANQCLQIQAVIQNENAYSLFDELINSSDFRNDTSQIVIGGMNNQSVDELNLGRDISNGEESSNHSHQNEQEQRITRNNSPNTNLPSDLLVEQNFYITLKKTVNLPKAVGKYMNKYHSCFQYTLFEGYPSFFNRISEDLNRLQEWIKKSKKNSFKLCNLMDFFNDTINKSPEQCGLNRLMMRKILVRYLRKEIIPNNQVKDKREYLVGSKVFALRCSNATLATRMQMR